VGAVNDSWLSAPASQVPASAQALLGWELSAHGVRVRLTEVEAYAGMDDPASHAFRGRTRRTDVMFGPAGFLYVYFTYGMHWCMNVVVGEEGVAAAVLLRAGSVLSGTDLARQRRGPLVIDRDLARGPARLASALGVDGSASGSNLLDGAGPVTLSPPTSPADPALIMSGPRVGVSTAGEVPWRFWLAGEPTVSVYRPHTPRKRATPTPTPR
jgi:DNA-3-methyladenine glycosylase